VGWTFCARRLLTARHNLDTFTTDAGARKYRPAPKRTRLTPAVARLQACKTQFTCCSPIDFPRAPQTSKDAALRIPQPTTGALPSAPPPRAAACVYSSAATIASAASTSFTTAEWIWIRTAAARTRTGRRRGLWAAVSSIRGFHERPHCANGFPDRQERCRCGTAVRGTECMYCDLSYRNWDGSLSTLHCVMKE
jgi:hypothetical protein